MARRATTRKKKQPAKFDRCVKKVKARGGAKNAYAVCTAAGTRGNPVNYYERGYSKGLSLGKTVRHYSDEVLNNFAHKWSAKFGDQYDTAFREYRRGLEHGIDEQQTRRQVRAPYAGRGNPAAASAEVFEEFHGYPPTEVVKVTQEVHHHTHLAAAGDLVGLEVKPVDHGAVRRIEGLGDAILAFNEAKNQLFIRGGDQKMGPKELAKFGITEEHELQTLGKLVAIGYFANKTHLGSEGGEAVYSHTFRTTNENGTHVTVKIARYPDLIYRVLDEQLEISGGSYEIRREGIDK
jgi:hypothetical protein